jgi:putative YphP/YqiW family bacilliredoxin
LRYPEQLISAMRQDLTRHGIEETRTPEEVDRILTSGSGSVLMVINSVCGCAAGKARPGVVLALQHEVRPDRVATVFAGADLEAVARVRELATNYPASSPSAILFRDGRPVYMLPRNQIENRGPQQIADALTQAFETHCAVRK